MLYFSLMSSSFPLTAVSFDLLKIDVTCITRADCLSMLVWLGSSLQIWLSSVFFPQATTSH